MDKIIGRIGQRGAGGGFDGEVKYDAYKNATAYSGR
jgi:hypothetical protein